MTERAGLRRTPWLVLAALLVSACGSGSSSRASSAPTRDPEATTSSPIDSGASVERDLGHCEDRLWLSELLHAVMSGAGVDAAAVTQLEAMNVPAEASAVWPGLVMAYKDSSAGRSPNSRSVRDAVNFLNDLVGEMPCDSASLDPAFGCASYDDCASNLIEGRAQGQAPDWIVAVASGYPGQPGWTVAHCEVRANYCRLQRMQGDSELDHAFLFLSKTLDGRVFDWRLQPEVNS